MNKFFFDFNNQWSENFYICNLSRGAASAVYLRMMQAPFYLSVIFGTLMLRVNDKWFYILKTSVSEFHQFNGFKLVIYAIFILVSASMSVHRITFVLRLIKYPLINLSNFFIGICSVFSGVFLGLSIPAAVSSEEPKYFIVGVLFVAVLSVFSGSAYMFSRLIDYLLEERIVDTKVGKRGSAFIILLGLSLFFYCLYELIWVETWIEPIIHCEITPL